MTKTLEEIINYLNSSLPIPPKIEIQGEKTVSVQHFSNLKEAQAGDLSFLTNEAYLQDLAETKASAILVEEKIPVPESISCPVLLMKNAYLGVALLSQLFHPIQHPSPSIHPTAVIEEDAEIGENVFIGAKAYIGPGCKIADNVCIYPNVTLSEKVSIGKESVLYANVTVYPHCLIGKQCIIHSGTIIGADGFGYATDGTGIHHKINQVGNVILKDHVEIGANCCIDRGASDSTIIGEGTKLDNLIQIGHGVKIGKGCLLVSQCGIAGSTTIGDYVFVGGQVGIAGKLDGPPIQIANGVQIGAQTGVDKDLKNPDYPKPKQYWGFPKAMEISEANKALVRVFQLGKYFKRIKSLEKNVEELKK